MIFCVRGVANSKIPLFIRKRILKTQALHHFLADFFLELCYYLLQLYLKAKISYTCSCTIRRWKILTPLVLCVITKIKNRHYYSGTHKQPVTYS